MGSLQKPNRFRPFNNQNSQGNFLQSLSGSETDVSTSNENLSNEEKYVIRHTARQEPQGQENQQLSNRSSLRDSLASNRSSLDVSSSSYNTLIIHSAGDEPWTGRNSIDATGSPYLSHQSSNLYIDPKPSQSPILIQKRPSSVRNSFDEQNTLNSRIYDAGVQEITEIPDDYLSQSSVLKQLAKEAKPSTSNIDSGVILRDFQFFDAKMPLPPPPEYPKWADKSPLEAAVNRGVGSSNAEKVALSKSQPDLSKVGVAGEEGCDFSGFKRGVSAPRPPTRGREESELAGGELWPSGEMVEILIKENSALKMELGNCYRRVAQTQKLEEEILMVHKSQEELVQSCDRKERLERAARGRLLNDNRRLQELNRALREQLDLISTQLHSRATGQDLSGPDHLRRELSKREVLIAQLIQQNKELVAVKERHEIELAAQRVTLQEQRTHIDILDTALTNAQENVVRLEEECRKKQVYVERVAQLQRALSSLQLASDRREQTERKLRLQLERELQRTKQSSHGSDDGKTGWDSPNGSGTASPSELKRRLREKDEKIMRLEGDCSKWEQRYLEENALRQAAIDAASLPKDAKIAALEKTSQETEKIIAEARNEKIRHMDEVHAAQKRVADLESRMKDLESKLAERDAMIKVLQKHTYDKDVSSMLGRSPHHTPHASLGGADMGLGTTVSREDLVSSVLTNSTGFGSGNSYAGSDSSYHMASYSKYDANKNFDSTKQTLDNQLKEIDSQLDSQLLSKRGLCCFPGFTNPVTASRKGKLPKPLLASVVTGTVPSRSATPTRLLPPASAASSSSTSLTLALLEKQGRASQQQREVGGEAGAPSSLPRPPRPARSGLPRYNRFGEAPEAARKRSDGGESLSSGASSRRGSPARAIVPPRKLGEYGRLSESGGSSGSLLRKPQRDSASTLMSDNSASSLPPPAKVRLFGGGARRGGSLGRERDSKSSTDSQTSKYRIQF